MIVTVGETVEFSCRCEGSNSIPSWIIQGSNTPSSELTYPYEYIPQTLSLIVYDVTLSLNQTTIQCSVNGQRSTEAVLLIRPKGDLTCRV